MWSGRRCWSLVVLAATLAACGDPPKPGPPANMAIVAGSGATAQVGAPVPTLGVRVTDKAGRNVPGATVTWSATQGTVAPVSPATDDGGLAQAQWTLGTKAGAHSVTASTAGEGGVMVTASFTATATPGPASRMDKLGGDGQTGQAGAALPTQLALKVSDQYGNGIPNVAVSWSVTSGGGQCGGTGTTDSEGMARATWTMGTVLGPARVSASATGVQPVTFDATVTAGAVATVAVTPASSSLSVAQTVQLSATAKDQWGNVATGRTVSWSSSNSAVASVTTTGLVTAVGTGSATITATVEGKSGSATVSVSNQYTLRVTNELIDSISVSLNGSSLGVVPARSIVTWTGAKPTSVTLSWSLIRRRTTSGATLGDQINAIFATDYAPPDVDDYDIDNVLNTSTYFAPLIDNRTPVRLLMVVNWLSSYENRCNCVVPANTPNVAIGYYRLFTTTEVRAYNEYSSYTGGYVYWKDFSANIPAGSGSYVLWTTVTPSANRAEVAGTSSFDLAAALNALQRNDRSLEAGERIAGSRPQLVRASVRSLGPGLRISSPMGR